MTLPASPSNQMGPYYTSSVPVNTDPAVAPGAPPAIDQSPSGSVTGKASDWENANSELAVQNYTGDLVAAAHDGTAFRTDQPPAASNVAQTTPSAPTGSYVQEGTAVASGTVSFNTLNSGQFQAFRWQ